MDVDEDALAQARQAVYTERQAQGVFVFHRELRRSAIFGRHDLLQDAPISRINLLVCRNTLMYFNAEMQARIMTHFHFALAERGFLLLGKAEMLFTHTRMFVPVELKQRVFRRQPRLRARLLAASRPVRHDS